MRSSDHRRRASRDRRSRGSFCSVALVAASALASSTAQAQIVNVQPLLADDGREGFSGSIESALSSQQGNTNVASLGGQLVMRYRHHRHLPFLLASGAYGESNGVRNTNRDLEHGRYRYVVRAPIEVEAFAQHERDEFRRLGLRMLTGAGPRLHVASVRPLDVAVGVAYMLELEQLQNDGLPDAGERDVNHRLSSYVSVGVALGAPLKVAYTFYVQPRFDEVRDYRILSDLALLSTITKHWALKVALSLAYDSRPPLTVKGIDAARTASLALSF